MKAALLVAVAAAAATTGGRKAEAASFVAVRPSVAAAAARPSPRGGPSRFPSSSAAAASSGYSAVLGPRGRSLPAPSAATALRAVGVPPDVVGTTVVADAAASATSAGGMTIDWPSLLDFALRQAITAGVPALFLVAVTAFAAKAFSGGGKKGGKGGGGMMFGDGNDWNGSESAVDDLYDDLYGDPNTKNLNPASKFASFLPGGGGGGGRGGRGGGDKSIPARNLGIPAKKYLRIEKLNDRYDSYSYSFTSATQSKALAASKLREVNFDNALRRAASSSLAELTPAEKTDLLRAERELLKVGGRIAREMRDVQRELTDGVIREEMRRMDVEVGELDPETGETLYVGAKDDEGVIVDAVIEEEKKDAADGDKPFFAQSEKSDAAAADVKADKKNVDKKGRRSDTSKSSHTPKTPKANVQSMLKSSTIKNEIKSLETLNTELVKLELSFIRAVVEIMGPERANGIRAAVLGNEEGGVANAGALLKSLEERPLSAVLSGMGYAEANGANGANGGGKTKRPRRSLFVMDFPGDVAATQVANLREEVTAVVRSAQPGDEALLVLQSGGGTVTGYGLAAAQLSRFKERGIKLTVAVEQVAASGGYMMCCVADHIVASPFAVLGSIGVISDTPNFYERLKKEGVEFQTVTAGKYKRTLTPTKKPTPDDIKKQKDDLEDILVLFKKFVGRNRPGLDIDAVATGETWFGEDALERGLCDEIRAVDDVLADYVDEGYDVYDVAYDPPPEEAASNLLAGLPFGDAPTDAPGRIRAAGRGGGAAAAAAAAAAGGGGPVRSVARWVARSVVPAVAEEFMDEMRRSDLPAGGVAGGDDGGVSKRYTMKDDSADRIRAED